LVENGERVVIVGRTLKKLETAAIDILSNCWQHMQNTALKKKIQTLVEASETESLLNEISKNNQDRTELDLLYYYWADLSQENEVDALYTALESMKFEVCTLYNVAGAGVFCQIEDITTELIQNALNSNLIHLILMCSRAVRVMKETGGKIINVMSSAAKRGNPLETLYCASKFGAYGFTEAMKAELKNSKIQFIEVFPGGINSPFWDNQPLRDPPLQTFMDPHELAEQIVSIANEKNTLIVDSIDIGRKDKS
jgi:short-subunit dehydrogenase